MQEIGLLKQAILDGRQDEVFAHLYGEAAVSEQRTRYADALDAFAKLYPEKKEIAVFSAPGRSEIGGNHTDHNHGKTLAAGIHLDVIGIVAKSTRRLEVQSKGFQPDRLLLSEMDYDPAEENSAKALIKGVCNGFAEHGYTYGGFVSYTTSDVLKGSGISSSAAFEVLLCTILNHLYNEDKVGAVEIAQISQYAENVFFGKPCGLLDQMASSVGGFIAIDFADPANPLYEKIDFDFAAEKHALCIVDTGGNHSDLTGEYAAIPAEMKAVAACFGQETLRGITYDRIVAQAAELRKTLGDRAILRALHFVCENDRVDGEADALRDGRFADFLELVKASGRSSFMYLQNVYTSLNTAEQGLSLALCVSDGLLGKRGAYRVHGGGFGGTIQAFVPLDLLDKYRATLDGVFGRGACKVLRIRAEGGICVFD